MDQCAPSAAHPALPVLPDALPGVTKFVHAQPIALTTRQKAARFFHSPEGRDAALRLAQYTFRLALHLRRRALSKPLFVRLLAVVSSLAALRRLLALQQLVAAITDFSFLAPHTVEQASSTKHSQSASAVPTPRAHQLLHIIQQTLDLVAVITDNLYLFSRLRLVPLSRRTTARVDKASDYAALGAALAGFAQQHLLRRGLYAAGRRARHRAIEAEKRLEELEFWEGEPGAKPGAPNQDERAREERRLLRERVRVESRRLRMLRSELADGRWERVRLVAEAVFAVYDALDLERSAEAVKSWAGISSSLIEFRQAWVRHSGRA
ncbi:hypothetical protein JCM3770_002955 [Rhodotorula araucariae]